MLAAGEQPHVAILLGDILLNCPAAQWHICKPRWGIWAQCWKNPILSSSCSFPSKLTGEIMEAKARELLNQQQLEWVLSVWMNFIHTVLLLNEQFSDCSTDAYTVNQDPLSTVQGREGMRATVTISSNESRKLPTPFCFFCDTCWTILGVLGWAPPLVRR